METLLEADRRIAAQRTQVRELGSGPAGRELLAAGVAATQAWRDGRLAELFGPELATRVVDLEDGRTTYGMSPEGPDGAVSSPIPEPSEPPR